MTHNDTKYWLGLSLAPGIGTVRFQQLIEYFGSAHEVWQANKADLLNAQLPENTANGLISFRAKTNLEQELEKVQKVNARLITQLDDEYPTLLRKIASAPPLLYIKGNLTEADRRSIAIVGTRNASKYGREVTYKISKELAMQNVTIVSGLAQGIDHAAHMGAVTSNRRTIGVLGCGIDRVYPPASKKLVDDILEKEVGAILSEFPIGTPPSGINFPRRNRILSGMTLAVLIAEAPEQSGSLITAEYALEQGRDVFAIPASVFSPHSIGTNRLIQDGAKLVMNAKDILNELNLTYERVETREKVQVLAPTTENEKKVYAVLGYEPLHVDELTRMTSLRADEVSATLTMLELKGLAQMAGYMQYSRSHS
jgi:DNA processing protein